MQKWEYLYIIAQWQEKEAVWLPRFANDRELPDWKKGQTLSAMMNQLGDEGWELVSNSVVHGGGAYWESNMVLKRAKD